MFKPKSAFTKRVCTIGSITLATALLIPTAAHASEVDQPDTTATITETVTPEVVVDSAPAEETQTIEEVSVEEDAPAPAPITAPVESAPAPVSAPAPEQVETQVATYETIVEVPVVVADTTRPEVSLSSAPSAVNSSVVDLVILASDNVGLDRIVGNIRNASGVLVKPTQIAANGATSAELVVDLNGLANGSYELRYNAIDTSGNLSQTKSFTFTVDNTAPTVTIKPESKGIDGRYSTISFKLFDGSSKVDYVVINGAIKDLSNATYSDVNGVKPGTFGAVEGQNTMVVYDVAGNATTVTFVLDTKGPQLTVKPDSVGSDGVFRVLSLKLFDAAQVDYVVINGVLKDLSNNTYSDVNGLKPGTFGVVEGLNTIVAYDRLGNSTTMEFTIDTIKPVLNLPAPGLVSGEHTFSVSQTEANPDRTYVEYQVIESDANGKDKPRKLGGAWFYDTKVFDFTVDTTVLSDDARYQLKVSTWDKANNHTSAVSGFTVDNTGPTVTVKPESLGSDGVYESVSFKLYDLNQVDGLTLNGVAKDLTDNKWSDLNVVEPGKFGAVLGENILVVSDVAGNTTTVVFTLVAPVVIEIPETEFPAEENPETEAPIDELPELPSVGDSDTSNEESVPAGNNGSSTTSNTINTSSTSTTSDKSGKLELAMTGVTTYLNLLGSGLMMVLAGLVLKLRGRFS